jgi:hypothetical protein
MLVVFMHVQLFLIFTWTYLSLWMIHEMKVLVWSFHVLGMFKVWKFFIIAKTYQDYDLYIPSIKFSKIRIVITFIIKVTFLVFKPVYTFSNHFNEIFEPNMYLYLDPWYWTYFKKLVCVNSNIDTTLVSTYFILTNKKPKTQMPTHAINQGY